MGSPLIKRLDALYQRAQMVMKVQADHAPFVSIAPWSFMKNECRVEYFPEGHYQKPERITTTSLAGTPCAMSFSRISSYRLKPLCLF